MTSDDIKWIASRTYLAKIDGQTTSVTVAVGTPRKLQKDERIIDSDAGAFGCPVQTGAERTRRLVAGRDPLEALFHALLAIDVFLAAAEKNGVLTDERGNAFTAAAQGLLRGPIGREHMKAL